MDAPSYDGLPRVAALVTKRRRSISEASMSEGDAATSSEALHSFPQRRILLARRPMHVISNTTITVDSMRPDASSDICKAHLEEEHADLVSDKVLYNPDLLKLIFWQLDVTDICRVAKVCSSWRYVSDSDDFWKEVAFHGRAITFEQVLKVCQRHKSIQSLSLSGPSLNLTDEYILLELMQWLQQCHTLQLSCLYFIDAALQTISEHLPQLRKLKLVDVAITNSSVGGEARLTHPTVSCLQLHGCRVNRLFLQCPNLQRLSLSDMPILALSVNLPALQVLNFTNSSKISDTSLRSALLKLPSLLYLNLKHMSCITDDTLREVSQQLLALTYLDVSCCAALTLNGVRGFPSLRVLVLSNCDGLAPGGVQLALESFSHLEEVYLDSCILLTALTLLLPRLRLISLLGCRPLSVLKLKCQQLTTLLLGPPGSNGGCSAVHWGCSLRHIHLASAAIHRITWHQFASLQALELDCPNLVELNLCDCDSLDDTVFSMLSFPNNANGFVGPWQQPGCPQLQILRLENCEGLRHASLRHDRLHLLSLAGCKHLESLTLAAPCLESLALDECTELSSLLLKPVGFQRLALGACSGLSSLELWADGLVDLNLCGCGQLWRLLLACPALRQLDATFCGRLTEPGLQAAMTCQPPLEKLVLSVCSSVQLQGLGSLHASRHLRALDLSYTDVTQLDSVLGACHSLTALNLSSCKNVRPGSLLQILPSRGNALPQLLNLDISYCDIGAAAIAALLYEGTRLESLALNGCNGVNDEVWCYMHVPSNAAADMQQDSLGSGGSSSHSSSSSSSGTAIGDVAGGAMMAAGISAHAKGYNHCSLMPHLPTASALLKSNLSSLSMVRCSKLQSLCLGLAPEPSNLLRPPGHLDAKASSSSSSSSSNWDLAAAAASGAVAVTWVEAPNRLAGLKMLKLGLSAVQVVALQLPQLIQLDMSGCSKLRLLELRCPLLLTLYMQACHLLPVPLVCSVVGSCPALDTLDVQHTAIKGASAGAGHLSEALRGSGVRNFLCCCPGCSVCTRC